MDFSERAAALVQQMSLAEKVSQLQNDAPAVERLGLPAHNYWNECLHGVARAGLATVFPQAIGLAATWDTDLVHRVATAISDEARAKHHEAVRHGQRGIYQGLTFWSPNINLFRDPRWGRGQETYGEDPFLTGEMAVAFIRGLQGDDPRYLKVAATAKHFAVHSGPESRRHVLDVSVSREDLQQSYLPHFRRAVQEARVASVMTAYNRVEGEPCASQPYLLGLLRQEWGFDGYVVSDCDAINDYYRGHQVSGTPVEAAARALAGGCDLECGCVYRHLPEAVEQGLISESLVDQAARRVLTVRYRLGMLDSDGPYARIPLDVVDCQAHRDLALEAARKSIVLLANDGVLPLKTDRVLVVGAPADDPDVLLGNYHGTASQCVTLWQGLQRSLPHARYVPADKAIAVQAAATADVAVLVLGLTPRDEGEEGDGADRTSLDLAPDQDDLLEAVAATGLPCVVVLTGGSPPSIRRPVAAMLCVWYPGQDGGTALADVLCGRYNPSGRLPITLYRTVDDLPPFEDYSMRGRTHRFFNGRPLYRFGHGLSYSTFHRQGDCMTNDGPLDGDVVVQFYRGRDLCGFERLTLAAGQTRRMSVPSGTIIRW